MKRKELKRLLKYWQRELRLRDWEIRLQIDDKRSKDYGTGNAYIEYSENRRKAILHLITQKKQERSPWGDKWDPELSIVHELLHLWFSPFDIRKGSVDEVVEEQAVNAIAWALVAQRRKTNELEYKRPGEKRRGSKGSKE